MGGTSQRSTKPHQSERAKQCPGWSHVLCANSHMLTVALIKCSWSNRCWLPCWAAQGKLIANGILLTREALVLAQSARITSHLACEPLCFVINEDLAQRIILTARWIKRCHYQSTDKQRAENAKAYRCQSNLTSGRWWLFGWRGNLFVIFWSVFAS